MHDLAEAPIAGDEPREWVRAGESLVVLTRDQALTVTLDALCAQHRIVTVSLEADLAGALVAEHTGVAIVDTAAISGPVEILTERLKAQFPDLILIVAGDLQDQGTLTAQITSGTVYRFLHKPASEQRLKLFVDAAWRRHAEAHSEVAQSLAATGVLPQPRTVLPRNALIAGAVVMAMLVVLGGWLISRRPGSSSAAPTSTAEANIPGVSRDTELEDLLIRANQALKAGLLIAPEGASAADLYRQAKLRNGSDPRGAAGLEKVIDRLLSAAEGQLAAQHLADAQKLTDEARSVDPEHVRVAFLAARIAKERERAVLTQARRVASNGNIAAAIAVLDDASREGKRSTLVNETREELEHKKLDERVSGYLAKATDRLQRDQLVDPPQDNARFFIESARTIAPNQPEVLQATQQLNDRLIAAARGAAAAGNPQEAQHWLDAATQSGVSGNNLTDLVQQVRSAQTDNTQRLTKLFNERLSEGRITDPPADSAKYYLAQLSQASESDPSTLAARQALANRALDEAKASLGHQDYAGVNRWLTEAHDAGMDDSSVTAVEHDMTAAQNRVKSGNRPVSAGSLELAHYSAAIFPMAARERGVSGWVDIQFLVKADGSVSDVTATGAEPVGMFEQAAIDAVRKWRYKPVQRDGQTVDQRARLRMKFALDK